MKKILALLLAAVMVLSLCACGSGTDNTASAAPAGKTDSAASAQSGAGKDTAILATSDEPYRFFAQSKQSCSGADNLVLSNVYDCLLRLEADGTLTSALAETYEVSDDGLEYTFHLRKGVKFHNGQEMTAEDVKFTYDYGFEGPIGTALFVNYKQCDIIDDYTVKMTLSSPYAAFPYGVASRLGGIACKAYFDEVGDDEYVKNPIGTGPYKFVEWVSGDHTTLTANEDYWGTKPSIQNAGRDPAGLQPHRQGQGRAQRHRLHHRFRYPVPGFRPFCVFPPWAIWDWALPLPPRNGAPSSSRTRSTFRPILTWA